MTPADMARRSAPAIAIGRPMSMVSPRGVARYRTSTAITKPNGTRSFWIMKMFPALPLRRYAVGFRKRHSLAACFIDLVHGDIDNAFPVFQGTPVAFVAGAARNSAFHHNIFSTERPVTIAAGRSKNRDDRRSCCCCEVHGTCISADE